MPDSKIDILLQIRADLAGIKAAQKESTKLRQDLKKTTDFQSQVRQGLAQGLGIAGGLGVARGIESIVASIGKFAAAGVTFNATVEQQTVAFQTLLGSAEAAEQRIKELVEFARVTPFELPEIFQANKVLEVLSDGLLSTTRGMVLVGDAASSVGRGFRETAFWVGRLEAGLTSGTAVGEATLRLIELGLISGKQAKEMQRLAKESRSVAETWTILEDVFGDARGAMERQSLTFKGMVSNMRDFYNVLAGDKTRGIFNEIKEGMEEFLVLVDVIPSRTDRAVNEVTDTFKRLQTAIQTASTSSVQLAITNLDQEIERAEAAAKQLKIRQQELVTEAQTPGALYFSGLFSAKPEGSRSQEEHDREVELTNALFTQNQIQVKALRALRQEALTDEAIQRQAMQERENQENDRINKQKEAGLKILDEAQKGIEKALEDEQKRLGYLQRAQQTDKERLVTIGEEKVALEALRAERDEQVKTLEDEEKAALALEFNRAEFSAARADLLREEVELKKKIEASDLKILKANQEYQAAILQSKIDEVEHQKQIIDAGQDTLENRQKVLALDAIEKDLIADLIDSWKIYSSTIADPATRQEIEEQVSALRRQAELLDADRAQERREAAKETFDLQVGALQLQLDQIEGLKQLNALDLDTASNRKEMQMLIAEERKILNDLIVLWRIYGAGIKDPAIQQSIEGQIQGLIQQRDRLAATAQEPTLLEGSLAEFDGLRDPAQHFQDGFGAAAAALMDYQVQVGTVADQIHQELMSIQGALTGSIADSIEGLIIGTTSWGDAFRNVGAAIAQSVVTAFANMLANWITTQLTMIALQRVFGLQASAAGAIQATSLAAAWAPAAVAASIATLGGAATVGTAAFLASQLTATATSAGLSAASTLPGYAEGGYTGPGTKFAPRGMVHAGEFVTPADVVSRTGPQFFADQVSDVRSGRSRENTHLVVVDSRKDAERYLESADGEGRIMDIVALNKGMLL